MTDNPIGVFVAVFSDDATGVLLVQHSYNNGRWSLPGGALEFGEIDLAAGKREFTEETGLICEISRSTHVGTFFLRKSAGVVFLFVGKIVGGELNGSTNETVCTKFVSFDELGQYDIYPAQRAFIRRARAWRPGCPPIYDYPGGDRDPKPPK